MILRLILSGVSLCLIICAASAPSLAASGIINHVRRTPGEASPPYTTVSVSEAAGILLKISRVARGHETASAGDRTRGQYFLDSVDTVVSIEERILHDDQSPQYRGRQVEYVIKGAYRGHGQKLGCVSETRVLENRYLVGSEYEDNSYSILFTRDESSGCPALTR